MLRTAGQFLRQLRRFALILSLFASAALDYGLRGGWRWGLRERSAWLRRWSRSFLGHLGFRVRMLGEAPRGGFVCSNHLSYMDILVIGSLTPQVFLSKSDVKDWPLVGWYTKIAGTLYIDRAKRREVAEKDEDFRTVMEAGLGLTMFLEGTSTDGSQVLPFRSSLLGPACRHGWKVTPAYLEYRCLEGETARDVCYWGDMSFGPHLWNLLRVKRVDATVAFGQPRAAGEDRKALALELREEVLALRERARREEAVEAPGERVI